jgi:uncharacterized protein YneF (UPF0154 family)
MENLISLHELNTLDLNDQIYLYDILKYRWSKSNLINIKFKHSDKVPTFEDHVKHINSGKYKKIYKILLRNKAIGMIYIDIFNVNGTFIIPTLLKKVLKENGPINNKKMSLSQATHTELFKKHPEVEVHFATVNPKNLLSISNLLEFGYENIEMVLAIKTKNGIKLI